MKPLDAGQQRELEFLRSQRTGWPYRSAGTRWAFVVGLTLLGAAAIATLWTLARGLWVPIGSGAVILVVVLLSLSVFSSDRVLRAAVVASTPTLEDMQRGDGNRSWPG